MSEPLYRKATRDETARYDLGIVSTADVYTMNVVPVEPTCRVWRCDALSGKAGTRVVTSDEYCNPMNARTGEECSDGCGMVDVWIGEPA